MKFMYAPTKVTPKSLLKLTDKFINIWPSRSPGRVRRRCKPHFISVIYHIFDGHLVKRLDLALEVIHEHTEKAEGIPPQALLGRIQD